MFQQLALSCEYPPALFLWAFINFRSGGFFDMLMKLGLLEKSLSTELALEGFLSSLCSILAYMSSEVNS